MLTAIMKPAYLGITFLGGAKATLERSYQERTIVLRTRSTSLLPGRKREIAETFLSILIPEPGLHSSINHRIYDRRLASFIYWKKNVDFLTSLKSKLPFSGRSGKVMSGYLSSKDCFNFSNKG